MLDIREPLLSEYERWVREIGNDPYNDYCLISVHDVLRAHFLLVDYFFKEGEGLGGIGPKSVDLLHSAVSRQMVSYEGKSKWTNQFDIMATLFYGLIKNHPFHDCNKRTALLISLYYLAKVGRGPTTSQKEFEALTIKVADNQLSSYTDYDKFSKKYDSEILFISDFFKKKTRKIDKHHYILSYRQLNAYSGRT